MSTTTTTPAPSTASVTTTSQIHPQQPSVGIVRSVLSGDSISIQELRPDSVRKEYTLSHLNAPRLGNYITNDKPDTPFAWDSREFLRKKCIGKKVHFYVDYTTPTGKQYITLYLSDDLENSLNKQMISNGWAFLFRSTTGKDQKKPEYLNLIQLESEAISKELGIHNKNPISVQSSVRPSHTINTFDLFNKLKGKQLEAVVEQIKNASSYRVTILPSFHTIQVQLSGIQCPGYRKDASGTMVPEPFAVDAETFISKNVLHRDVQLTLDTFDKSGNLFGTVVCGDRDVAVELLKNGLGSYVAWSGSTRSAADQTNLKAAEQQAKDANLRIWASSAAATKTTTTTATSAASSGEAYPSQITGKVVDIGNSGQVGILTEAKQEIKVALSSIRVPTLLVKQTGNETSLNAEQQLNARFERWCAYEAKEWLRKRLIGQTVTAKLDYVRPNIEANNLPEKPFYSVYLGKGNVALGLVEAGWARLTEHKGADNRSIDYEALVIAENKAKKKNLGVHSNKDKAPKLNINDVSTDDKNLKSKATGLLPHIRGSQLSAVVDYVLSASRIKVYIERESCLINLILSGIRVPRQNENEQLSNQALAFSREQLHQHDVTIQVEDIDKLGNFIGHLTINSKSFALSLIEMGYASVYDPMQRLVNYKQFVEAEEKAKKARLNLWKDYDPEEEQRQYEAKKAAEEEKRAAIKAETAEGVVTSIASPTEVYVEFLNSKNQELSDLLKNLNLDETQSPSGFSPKVGDLVKAKCSQDDQSYRAKVLEVLPGGKYAIQYFDFGTSDEIALSRLRPLAPKYEAYPPLATLVSLAYIKSPSDSAQSEGVLCYLDEILDRTLSVDVQFRDETGRMHVVLKDKDGVINSELLRGGFARIDKNAKRGPQFAQFLADQDHAKKERQRIWQWGDIESDDEDDNNNNRRGFKKGGKSGRGRK
eukprot:gene9023-11053_t